MFGPGVQASLPWSQANVEVTLEYTALGSGASETTRTHNSRPSTAIDIRVGVRDFSLASSL